MSFFSIFYLELILGGHVVKMKICVLRITSECGPHLSTGPIWIFYAVFASRVYEDACLVDQCVTPNSNYGKIAGAVIDIPWILLQGHRYSRS